MTRAERIAEIDRHDDECADGCVTDQQNIFWLLSELEAAERVIQAARPLTRLATIDDAGPRFRAELAAWDARGGQ